MNRIGYIVLLLLFGFQASCFAQADPPKREFRAAWIATVVNLDWPANPTTGTVAQKEELITLLDELKDVGINVVIFQVRPECDALYDSPYEPWSYWLTGSQGSPPSPYYDPLEFAIEEAHARGMELHAWFNPYRSVREEGTYTLSPDHIYSEHPEWHFKKNDLIMLDPGIPDVREYVAGIITDVVRRYDIDGVHFDDYFYPYEGTTNSDDQETWDAYKGDFTNRGDWRRNNVNTLVSMVYDSVQATKPYVKFGISPFGIRKNSDAGTSGLDAYSTIYCDAVAWLNERTVDYLAPQVYWAFERPEAPYGDLVPWWASVMNGLHLYVGHGAHNLISTNSFPVGNWPASELGDQIRFNRDQQGVKGSVFFRADIIVSNAKNFSDSLKLDHYRYPALLPVMDWKDIVPPNEPQNLAYAQNESNGVFSLQWDLPFQATDGDSASRYVVYRFEEAPLIEDLELPQYILDVTNKRSFSPPIPEENQDQFYFLVRALDRNYNESFPSNVITVTPPDKPTLVMPADGAKNQSDTTLLSWSVVDQAGAYTVEVAADNQFESIVLTESVLDTQASVTGLEGLSTYYWRTKTGNAAGHSDYSQAYSFTTGFPVAPELSFPRSGTVNIPLEMTFEWYPADSADVYRYQLGTSSFFQEGTVILDTVVTDTSVTISGLDDYTRYYWRVSASNEYGSSNFSEVWALRTVTSIFEDQNQPLSFKLGQNYPNPFNPVTTIDFSVARAGYTSLIIYNVLGQKVATLVDGTVPAGVHQARFDASSLPTGIYIYRLVQGNKVQVRKMMVLK